MNKITGRKIFPRADVDMPQAKRRVTFSRPPVGVGVSQAWCVETWTLLAAAGTAQAITASGETRRPEVVDKIQRFNYGGDGDPVEASFAATLPTQIGDAKTWSEAFVVLGCTPHLISRRWLSQHRGVVNFDSNNCVWQAQNFVRFLLCFTHLVTCFCHL